MKNFKLLFLVCAVVSFMVACSKDHYEPPALGDHTENTGDNNNGDNNNNDGDGENNDNGGEDNNGDDNNGGEDNTGDQDINGKLVLSLGENWGNIIGGGPKGILYVRSADLFFHIYTPDADGVFDEGTKFADANSWDASAGLFYVSGAVAGATPDNPDGTGTVDAVFVWNTPPAGLFRFDPEANGDLTNKIHPTTSPSDPFPTNFGFWYGDGWDQYKVVPLDDYILIIDNAHNREVLSVDKGIFTSDWSTWDVMGNPPDLHTYSRPHVDLGMTIADYLGAVGLDNHLLVIRKDGSLMSFNIDDDGKLDEGTQIGSGWDRYTTFVSDGKDLLVMDEAGNIYRYHIDFDSTTNNPVSEEGN